MDELIGRIVANVGVDRSIAEKAVGIILDFLIKEGPADKVKSLVDGLPGADAVVQATRGNDSGGVFGGMGGIMGVGSRLMGIGLAMNQIQGVTREVMTYAREKAGAPTVDEVVGAIPGLSQFI
jgi:hypothetical protein